MSERDRTEPEPVAKGELMADVQQPNAEGPSLLGLPKPTNRAWRERAITRAAEIRMMLGWFKSQDDEGGIREKYLDEGIERHVLEAITAATAYSHPWPNAAIIERVMSNLDAAESALLRRAPTEYFCGQYTHILAHVRRNLPEKDPRRVRVEILAAAAEQGHLDTLQRESIIQAVAVASSRSRSEFIQVSNFRSLLLVTAVLLSLVAFSVGAWGWMNPDAWALCFNVYGGATIDRVCPTGRTPTPVDVFLVEFIGLLAAMVSGATSFLSLNSTSTALGLPVAVAVLKLPIGALTAVLGFMLLRAGFVPGFTNLDSSAQILAYAALFGASQQLFTRVVDHRASEVLSEVPDGRAI
jgi:hypothetical protein